MDRPTCAVRSCDATPSPHLILSEKCQRSKVVSGYLQLSTTSLCEGTFLDCSTSIQSEQFNGLGKLQNSRHGIDKVPFCPSHPPKTFSFVDGFHVLVATPRENEHHIPPTGARQAGAAQAVLQCQPLSATVYVCALRPYSSACTRKGHQDTRTPRGSTQFTFFGAQ